MVLRRLILLLLLLLLLWISSHPRGPWESLDLSRRVVVDHLFVFNRLVPVLVLVLVFLILVVRRRGQGGGLGRRGQTRGGDEVAVVSDWHSAYAHAGAVRGCSIATETAAAAAWDGREVHSMAGTGGTTLMMALLLLMSVLLLLRGEIPQVLL